MDVSAIRTWARGQGFQVGERGRLDKSVVDAFNNANPWVAKIEPTFTYCQECDWQLPDHAAFCSKNVTVQVVATVPAPTVVPAAPAAPVQPPKPQTDLEAAMAAFVTAVAPVSALDETRVREIAEEVALSAVSLVAAPVIHMITVGDRPSKEVDGPVHAKFADVVKIVGAGLHAYLVGGPGTGKTTLCGQVADALSLPFGMIPCDPTMPASKLFGFVDAGGQYRPTVFRDIYENGGVFLFDELDNAHPGIIASINGAIANGHCAFPDGMVKRHADFRCVAAANTLGTGATRAFVGRNQLDAATLDRFVTVVVEIDEGLEESLTRAQLEDQMLAGMWLEKIRTWRRRAAEHNLQVIISPRASIEGATLLRVGFGIEEVAEMKVWKGIDKGTRSKIEGM